MTDRVDRQGANPKALSHPLARLDSQVGFTVLELAIALLIAMLVSALAMDLLRLWMPQLHHIGSEVVVRDRLAALTLIRRDVHAAQSVSGGDRFGQWTTAPLELATDIGAVRWLVVPDEAAGQAALVRQVTGDDGTVGSSVLLQEVTGWRWRVVAGVVEIEMARASERRQGSADAQLTERTERLALMPRGNSRTHW